MEIWKDIKDYEGLYQISNLGRVKSLKCNNNRILKLHINEYIKICIYKNDIRKHLLIHRLIAEAFIPNPNNYPQINHINGIKHDNRIENLEWCTQSQNIIHAYNTGLQKTMGEKSNLSKLTESQVLEIRALKGKMTQREIASLYNVGRSNVSFIHLNKSWKHI